MARIGNYYIIRNNIIMNICFCTDHYQINYCLTAIKSLLFNLANENDVVITVFCDDLETQKIISNKCNKNNIKVNTIILHFDDEILLLIKTLRQNMMNFGRMYIPLYMDDNFVYLDNDIIVNCDITTIIDDISNDYPLWAMPQISTPTNPQSSNYITEKCAQLYKIEKSYPFFNSGVMYVDIDYWKNNDITEKCENILKEHCDGPLYTHGFTQPILNIIYVNNYGKLGEVWNYRGECRNIDNIKIFHWYGSKKPNKNDLYVPNLDIWKKYHELIN